MGAGDAARHLGGVPAHLVRVSAEMDAGAWPVAETGRRTSVFQQRARHQRLKEPIGASS
jgi:hypothetical protein